MLQTRLLRTLFPRLLLHMRYYMLQALALVAWMRMWMRMRIPGILVIRILVQKPEMIFRLLTIYRALFFVEFFNCGFVN